MSLMIVEDNPEVRRVIKRVLSGIATEIVECDGGIAAFEVYGQCRPDWVLMDIEMEGGDGIMATRRITDAYPDARVIIVTGHGDEPLRDAARDAGAYGYILKENLLELRRFLRASS